MGAGDILAGPQLLRPARGLERGSKVPGRKGFREGVRVGVRVSTFLTFDKFTSITTNVDSKKQTKNVSASQ